MAVLFVICVMTLVAKLSSAQVLGGELDENGCNPAAGYSWCAALSECIRAWETDCSDDDTDLVLGGDLDDNGCKASAGYSWCESLSECIRAWETDCGDPTPQPTPQPIYRRRRSRNGDAQPVTFGEWLWDGTQFLKIPDKVPTVFVFYVAILVLAVVAAVRCWQKKSAQKQYEPVLFGDVMASDVEVEVDEAIGA